MTASASCITAPTFVEAVSEKSDAGAYFVERDADGRAVETPLDTRRLKG